MGGFAEAWSILDWVLSSLMEPAAAGAIAWFLAGIFTISGIAKVCDPARAAIAIINFRVIGQYDVRLGIALGIAELFCAILLVLAVLVISSALWLALAIAAAALWTFAMIVLRSLLAGDRFACFCFGESTSLLSWWTMARTAALAILASWAAVWAVSGAAAFGAYETSLQLVVALAALGIGALAQCIPTLVENRERQLQTLGAMNP